MDSIESASWYAVNVTGRGIVRALAVKKGRGGSWWVTVEGETRLRIASGNNFEGTWDAWLVRQGHAALAHQIRKEADAELGIIRDGLIELGLKVESVYARVGYDANGAPKSKMVEFALSTDDALVLVTEMLRAKKRLADRSCVA